VCASCFFIGMCSCSWGNGYLLYPSIFFAFGLNFQKFAQGGDCWVFVLTALLLKQMSLYVLFEPMFQHVVRHLCKMLNTMLQHPGMVQCAWVHAYLYARLLLFKETIFPYLIDQATHISLQNQLWNIPTVVFIF